MLTLWKESYDHLRQLIKKQKHYFVNKGPCSQGYGFSSGHVWMWKLDCEDSWEPKNLCFWTLVLEKILESPMDCKEIHPVHPKGDQLWVFIGRTDVKAETLILWPPYAKTWLILKDPDAGKDWGKDEKGATQDEMVGSHHRLWTWVGWTPGWTGKAWCAAVHGVTKSCTRLSDWTELIFINCHLNTIWAAYYKFKFSQS